MFDTLADTGRVRNTVFIFMSDHGLSSGQHRWQHKLTPYEESIRIPLYVRYDAGRTLQGARSRSVVANVDITPTILELTGTALPSVEGRSLRPLLIGAAEKVRDMVLLEQAGIDGDIVPPYCGVRTSRYTYARYAGGFEELYDLQGDPYQLQNVARSPAYAAIVARLDDEVRWRCGRRLPASHSRRWTDERAGEGPRGRYRRSPAQRPPSDRGRRLVRSRGRGGCLGDRRPGPHRAVLLAGRGATRCRTRGSRWQRGGVRERVAVRRRGGGPASRLDRDVRLRAPAVTPRWEQTHPRRAMRRFVRVAREHGLRAVLAPSRSLAGPDPLCDRFLRCGYLEIPADAFQPQSQKLQCDLDVFRPFVKSAGRRAASPLIVQLTVIWEDPCVTPKVVRNACGRAALGGLVRVVARPGDPQGLEALRLIAAAQG